MSVAAILLASVLFLTLCLPRMTILPPTDKLKMLLDKVKEFHRKFTQKYS